VVGVSKQTCRLEIRRWLEIEEGKSTYALNYSEKFIKVTKKEKATEIWHYERKSLKVIVDI